MEKGTPDALRVLTDAVSQRQEDIGLGTSLWQNAEQFARSLLRRARRSLVFPYGRIPPYKAMAWERRNAQHPHRRTGFQWLG